MHPAPIESATFPSFLEWWARPVAAHAKARVALEVAPHRYRLPMLAFLVENIRRDVLTLTGHGGALAGHEMAADAGFRRLCNVVEGGDVPPADLLARAAACEAALARVSATEAGGPSWASTLRLLGHALLIAANATDSPRFAEAALRELGAVNVEPLPWMFPAPSNVADPVTAPV